MSDDEMPAEAPSADKPVPPKRSPGHRGADVRDTVAEMAAKAHEISLEAGSKMAAAMKDVIGAAAGLSAFSIESARDLVQFMVRRSQMTQEEADKLIIEAENAWLKKNKGKALPTKPEPVVAKPAAKPAAKAAPAKAAPAAKAAPVVAKKAAAPAAKKAAPVAKKPAPKK
jgi:polyhydroxyalkanoate synthesis regulator phasin